ncbi:type 2 DNA topoisomerase 6 subunit A [Candidatus Methanoplasma termitum]|uniref:Type 2 DNA topoisomerase 6 subunit A n=1 Tax=Candidatus Methanoplasma termitum TaxID=1577791 RepID=A0A0A7LBY6_9ARCH|nr:DNA topoisomerase IV subunit A [Candidatus Methanoplasma termitum]AIZ56665.1 type 2 DNA topoisomerase 6 subunit A [Candidatus Methanoplasma termitum]MCL2333309.1 DNA topoisomerase IV subunit A [Candidatus Methanoplasma sp.]
MTKKRKRRLKTLATNERQTTAMNNLTSIVGKIYDQLDAGSVPLMELPLRSKKNIEFDTQHNVWKYGDLRTNRTAKTVQGAQMMLRTVYTADFINEMIKENKSSTLREMYYISEGWEHAKFNTQDESNLLAEDLEIISRCMREDFKLRPEESGAHVYGNLDISTMTKKGMKKFNCIDDVAETGFAVPYNVEKENFEIVGSDAKFIMAIETGGMFARLIENGFPERYGAILVHLSGQPARSTRRLIKRLNEERNLPVTVFTDGDPWSFRIFASVAYGAIKTAHISEYLATPTAQFIGITASDILNYDLPTDKLSDKDVGALNAELSDPRFNDGFWDSEIKAMLEMKKKSEQQALAKYGLDFVTDNYLPEKLTDMGVL